MEVSQLEMITEPATESVTEPAEAISKSICELSIQQPSDQSSDSSSTSKKWPINVRRKVILCYPEWTSKRIFMGDIQNSGLDLVKVARDFDNLTLPEPSTNIVLRFTYYNDKSYDFAWKEKITDAMRANPKNQLWLQNESYQEDLDYIPVFDPRVDDHAYDLLLNGIEQCYWNRVLRRVFYDSDEDDVEDVKEDAVEDVDEEMGYEDEDEDEDGAEFDEFDKLHDHHFF